MLRPFLIILVGLLMVNLIGVGSGVDGLRVFQRLTPSMQAAIPFVQQIGRRVGLYVAHFEQLPLEGPLHTTMHDLVVFARTACYVSFKYVESFIDTACPPNVCPM